jgi:hypothetical protein
MRLHVTATSKLPHYSDAEGGGGATVPEWQSETTEQDETALRGSAASASLGQPRDAAL